jgi:hypothetical protein
MCGEEKTAAEQVLRYGARRIRTADLLGAIRNGGLGNLRGKWLMRLLLCQAAAAVCGTSEPL